jgi:hypothetical protein
MDLKKCASLLLAGVLLSACVYYDSRWGQATAEQKHAAARLRPAQMEARRETSGVVARHATIRACATAAYAAETLDWESRFEELVRNASSVLEPSLGLTLRSAGTAHWQPPHGEGSLATIIADLPSCEGAEADWVVALVQSTPKIVSDFHVLGRGREYSPYLAVRASNDPAELEALTRSLPDLDEATRAKLYSDRKRHKTLTVFLHELGHTLGGLHRTAKDTIMSSAYQSAARGYDVPTLTLLRAGLEIRLDKVNRFRQVREYLEAHPDGFAETERLESVALLAGWERSMPVAARPWNAAAAKNGGPVPVAAPSGTDAVPAPAQPSVVAVAFETMPKQDRQIYDEALRLESTSARDAWSLATPLFEAHPSVRAVQELRCRLAKARKFYAAVVEAHCARLTVLAPATDAEKHPQ